VRDQDWDCHSKLSAACCSVRQRGELAESLRRDRRHRDGQGGKGTCRARRRLAACAHSGRARRTRRFIERRLSLLLYPANDVAPPVGARERLDELTQVTHRVCLSLATTAPGAAEITSSNPPNHAHKKHSLAPHKGSRAAWSIASKKPLMMRAGADGTVVLPEGEQVRAEPNAHGQLIAYWHTRHAGKLGLLPNI
jgi:hypothetical protein